MHQEPAEPLRQNVQRALNRGENYHQLHRAVSYANFGELRFRTEYEQHLWGECSRLLTNCIIAYNPDKGLVQRVESNRITKSFEATSS